MNTDAKAIHSLAVQIWRSLTDAQRSAMRRSRAAVIAHRRTVDALELRGLVNACAMPTPLGVLVRADGLAADAEDAKRIHRRRARARKAAAS